MVMIMMAMRKMMLQLVLDFPPLKPFPLMGRTYCRPFTPDGSDESLTVPRDGSDDLLNRSPFDGSHE